MNLPAILLWLVVWLAVRRLLRARDWFDVFVASELLAGSLLAALILWMPPVAASAWWILVVLLLTVVESLVLMSFLVRARHNEGPFTPGLDPDSLLKELEHDTKTISIEGEFEG